MIEKQSCSPSGPEVHASVPPASPNTETPSAAAVCPRCSETFTRRRKDQRYCSKPCAKTGTRNATRGSQRIADSADARRRQEGRTGRLNILTNALYETAPAYRAAFLESLIAQGQGNVELRQLLTLRHLLQDWTRGVAGRIGIAHSVDHYCREVYGLRSYEVLDPSTALPSADALAFPAEYFGPDAPPVYEDGTLKKRPCPWATRKEE